MTAASTAAARGVVAVASVPNPPLLLRGASGRRVAEVEQLRAACVAAIAHVSATADRFVLIGAAEPAWDGRPLSECVGRSLLSEAAVVTTVETVFVPSDAASADCIEAGHRLAERDGRLALLVMADGSARRSLKAPGYLDERAAGFDQQIVDALRTADARALATLDARLAEELMVAGRAPWQVLAGAIEASRTPFTAVEHYLGDPFGVLYPVFSYVR